MFFMVVEANGSRKYAWMKGASEDASTEHTMEIARQRASLWAHVCQPYPLGSLVGFMVRRFAEFRNEQFKLIYDGMSFSEMSCELRMHRNMVAGRDSSVSRDSLLERLCASDALYAAEAPVTELCFEDIANDSKRRLLLQWLGGGEGAQDLLKSEALLMDIGECTRDQLKKLTSRLRLHAGRGPSKHDYEQVLLALRARRSRLIAQVRKQEFDAVQEEQWYQDSYPEILPGERNSVKSRPQDSVTFTIHENDALAAWYAISGVDLGRLRLECWRRGLRQRTAKASAPTLLPIRGNFGKRSVARSNEKARLRRRLGKSDKMWLKCVEAMAHCEPSFFASSTTLDGIAVSQRWQAMTQAGLRRAVRMLQVLKRGRHDRANLLEVMERFTQARLKALQEAEGWYHGEVIINWVQYFGPPGPFSFPDSRDLLEVLGGLSLAEREPPGRIP